MAVFRFLSVLVELGHFRVGLLQGLGLLSKLFLCMPRAFSERAWRIAGADCTQCTVQIFRIQRPIKDRKTRRFIICQYVCSKEDKSSAALVRSTRSVFNYRRWTSIVWAKA